MPSSGLNNHWARNQKAELYLFKLSVSYRIISAQESVAHYSLEGPFEGMSLWHQVCLSVIVEKSGPLSTLFIKYPRLPSFREHQFLHGHSQPLLNMTVLWQFLKLSLQPSSVHTSGQLIKICVIETQESAHFKSSLGNSNTGNRYLKAFSKLFDIHRLKA